MKKIIEGTYAYKVDIGKVRIVNEDNTKVFINSDKNIFLVVCDGMGGENAGDLATNLMMEYINEEFHKKSKFYSYLDVIFWLRKLYKNVNKLVNNESLKKPELKGMGATLVTAFLYKNKLIVTNVGDSRCYIFKDDELTLLTEDQTFANYLYATGEINKNEVQVNNNRHVLTNAIGIYPSISYDMRTFDYNNESILLCSDGLYNNLSNKDILAILSTKESSVEKVNSLIFAANHNGGSDNIAVCLWESKNV